MGVAMASSQSFFLNCSLVLPTCNFMLSLVPPKYFAGNLLHWSLVPLKIDQMVLISSVMVPGPWDHFDQMSLITRPPFRASILETLSQ